MTGRSRSCKGASCGSDRGAQSRRRRVYVKSCRLGTGQKLDTDLNAGRRGEPVARYRHGCRLMILRFVGRSLGDLCVHVVDKYICTLRITRAFLTHGWDETDPDRWVPESMVDIPLHWTRVRRREHQGQNQVYPAVLCSLSSESALVVFLCGSCVRCVHLWSPRAEVMSEVPSQAARTAAAHVVTCEADSTDTT